MGFSQLKHKTVLQNFSNIAIVCELETIMNLY